MPFNTLFTALVMSLIISVSVLDGSGGTVSENTSSENVAVTNESFTFRGVEWGLPMSDLITAVIANEAENGLTEDGYKVGTKKLTIYETTVGGYKCQAEYFLVNGKFADGAYFLTEDHSNIEQYYADYNDLLDKYTQKYGTPQFTKKNWIGDSIYKDKPDSYGMAVGLGELELTAQWKAKDGSLITFEMTGDNYDITIRIDYLCPGYFDLEGLPTSDEGI